MANGGAVAGLQPKCNSVLAFERDLIKKRECDTLNLSRGLAQGHGMAEVRCDGAGRPASMARSGAGTELAVRAVACSSGLRISTGGLVGFLRTRAGGQEGSEMADGEQSRQRVDLPAAETREKFPCVRP